MSIILIAISFIILWFLIKYEVNRTLRNVIKDHLLQDQQKITADDFNDKEKMLHENRFIYWHKEKEAGEELERSMNDAIEKMRQEKQSSRDREYQEYLNWCNNNGKQPRGDVVQV